MAVNSWIFLFHFITDIIEQ